MVAIRHWTRNVIFLIWQFILPFIIGVFIALIILGWSSRRVSVIQATLENDLEHTSELVNIIGKRMTPTATVAVMDEVDEDSYNSGSNMNEPKIEEDLVSSTSVALPTGESNQINREEEMEEQRQRQKEKQKRYNKGQFECRHRWTKYLDQNKIFIPTELSSQLQRYNRLHDKLLRTLPIEEAFQLPLTSPKNTVNYVVWRPVGDDLSGRLLSLVSAFLIALLTDRALLVNFPYVRTLFCEPFTRSSWIFPQGRLSDLNKFTPLQDALQTRKLLRVVRLKLKEGFQNDDSMYLICNGDIKSMLSHGQILLVESPVGFVELLFSNPSYQSKIENWFQGSSIYGQLIHHLLKPSNDMWFRLIDSYHFQYTNNIDRPSRLAIQSSKIPNTSWTRCAIQKCPVIPFSSGKYYYISGSSIENPQPTLKELLKEPNSGQKVGDSLIENSKPGYLQNYRRLLTDMWMISWANEYVFDNVTTLSLLGLYFRGKDGWVVDEATSDGTCSYTKLDWNWVPTIEEQKLDCKAFGRSWKLKYRKQKTDKNNDDEKYIFSL